MSDSRNTNTNQPGNTRPNLSLATPQSNRRTPADSLAAARAAAQGAAQATANVPLPTLPTLPTFVIPPNFARRTAPPADAPPPSGGSILGQPRGGDSSSRAARQPPSDPAAYVEALRELGANVDDSPPAPNAPPQSGGAARSNDDEQRPGWPHNVFGPLPVEESIVRQRDQLAQRIEGRDTKFDHSAAYLHNQYTTDINVRKGGTPKDRLIGLLKLPKHHPLRSKDGLAKQIWNHLDRPEGRSAAVVRAELPYKNWTVKDLIVAWEQRWGIHHWPDHRWNLSAHGYTNPTAYIALIEAGTVPRAGTDDTDTLDAALPAPTRRQLLQHPRRPSTLQDEIEQEEQDDFARLGGGAIETSPPHAGGAAAPGPAPASRGVAVPQYRRDQRREHWDYAEERSPVPAPPRGPDDEARTQQLNQEVREQVTEFRQGLLARFGFISPSAQEAQLSQPAQTAPAPEAPPQAGGPPAQQPPPSDGTDQPAGPRRFARRVDTTNTPGPGILCPCCTEEAALNSDPPGNRPPRLAQLSLSPRPAAAEQPDPQAVSDSSVEIVATNTGQTLARIKGDVAARSQPSA